MKRSLSILVFALVATTNLLAQTIETPVSYAYLPGRESTLKYKFSFGDETFYTNLRFIKGSQSVFQAGDQIVMTPGEGNPTTFVVTEEMLKNYTSDYLQFETSAEGMENMMKGIKSISLIRDGQTYGLVQNNYFNTRSRKDANNLTRDAYELEKIIEEKKLLNEKKELATLRQEYGKVGNVEKYYNRVFIGYASTDFYKACDEGNNAKKEGSNEIRVQGFNAGWLGGFNVTKSILPLYLETGITMKAGFPNLERAGEGAEDIGDDRWWKTLSLEVPVNITYRYNIPHTKVRLSPYFGFHFKVNVLATNSYTYEVPRYDNTGKLLYYESYRERANLFDSYGTRRFQFGMQVGANFEMNHFYIGAGWDRDFMPVVISEKSDIRNSGMRVNIGWTF